MKRFLSKLIAMFLIVSGVATNFSILGNADNNVVVDLSILGTSDIHMHLMNYDYYQTIIDDKVGLVKGATIINNVRSSNQNTLLFDNGDAIQGNPLADYVFRNSEENVKHPLYRAFEYLEYDAITMGNHEFNYGLDFLSSALKDVNFPVVNANVYDINTNENYFTPYTILNEEVVDRDGVNHTIKVGVIGFVPPQIMEWDRGNLQGKVYVEDAIETAEKFIPQMQSDGADVIVALSHSGAGSADPAHKAENFSHRLTSIAGIDAVIGGHSHNRTAEVTAARVPIVFPGSFGSHVGKIDLQLEKNEDVWVVNRSASKAEIVPIYDDVNNVPTVEVDDELVKIVKPEHERTITFVNTEIGRTTKPINSFFSLVQDDYSVELVTIAQKWYMEKNRDNLGEAYKDLPILSVAAPFKAGRNGQFTNIPKGPLAIRNMADLYVYPNTVYAVLVTGADLKEWLEMSAGQFNQIDINSMEEQMLVNASYPTYNFDVIDGIDYEIDVTQPAKYDTNGNLINQDVERIVNISYNGKNLEENEKFVVVTNNYRGSSSTFPGVKNSEIIYEAPDENRQVIVEYIQAVQEVTPNVNNNWKFSSIDTDINITFFSSVEAKNFIDENSNISFLRDGVNGMALYNLNMKVESNVETPETPDEIVKHWVNFETNGGSLIDRIQVNDGEHLRLPTEPVKKGYKFDGWYTSSDLSKLFDSNEVITNELTLYAKWKEVKDETPLGKNNSSNLPETGDRSLSYSLFAILIFIACGTFFYVWHRRKNKGK